MPPTTTARAVLVLFVRRPTQGAEWNVPHRTRSLGDLMLAHAVTNLALSLYVIRTERWMFWM
jgi:hypothetical protein